jgi:hypothetical protein
MANLITQSDGLRRDITLVVDENDVRLLDEHNREIPMPAPAIASVLHAPTTLQGKLDLFEWLHERFPNPELAPRQEQPPLRVLPPFHRSGAVARTIRFSAAPSAR